jgi:hypothetical protein
MVSLKIAYKIDRFHHGKFIQIHSKFHKIQNELDHILFVVVNAQTLMHEVFF